MTMNLLRTCTVIVLFWSLSACNQDQLVFEQVATGSNGPREPIVSYFQTQQEADASWLPSVLGTSEYQSLVAKIDFSRHMVVAVATGEQENFSGAIHISRIYEYIGVESRPINVGIRVGVFPQKCFSSTSSRPFAVAVVGKPAKLSADRGYDRQNYEDSCK